MAMRESLAATAILLLSISAAPACDDYPEEMALAAARRDAAPAQLPGAQAQSTAQVVAPTTDAVVVEPVVPQVPANANLAGASPTALR